MGETHHDRAGRAAIEKMSGEEYTLCAKTLKRLRSGRYDSEFVDRIFQVDPRAGYSLETAYAFMHLFAWILHGNILTTEFEVGFDPVSDAELGSLRDPLNLAMNKMLPTELSPYLGSQPEGADGWLRFPQHEVRFTETTLAEKGKVQQRRTIVIGDFDVQAPLEVGATSACKTMLQLKDHGCVARWPYGHKSIWLAYAPEPL